MKKSHYIIIAIIGASTGNIIYLFCAFMAYFFFINSKHPGQTQEIKKMLKAHKEMLLTIVIFFVVFCSVIIVMPKNFPVAAPFLLPAFFFSILHLRAFKKSRLYEDIPTSKIRSVAMGLVEVKGKVMASDQINNDPIFNKPCVYYQIIIAKRARKNRYRTIYKDMKSESFFLEDDTGSILIPGDLIPDIQKHYFQRKSKDRKFIELQGIDEKDVIKFDYDIRSYIFKKRLPNPIKEFLDKINVAYSNRIRVTIKYIEPGDNIYILGTARPLHDSEQEYKSRAVAAIGHSGEDRFTISDFSEKELIQKAKQGSLVRLTMIAIFILIGSIILFVDIPL